MATDPIDEALFRAPAILLAGPVDYEMYKTFRSQLEASAEQELVVVELSTLGGDPKSPG